MRIEDLQAYELSMELAEKVWRLCVRWDYFAKDTLGKQLIRAADSISVNLSEGFGRFSYKENRQFCYYSRGSLSETKTWLTKAKNRNLIPQDEFRILMKDIDTISIKLNNYIRAIGKQAVNK